MIDARVFEDVNPVEHCVAFTYAVQSMAFTCRVALENDTSGIEEGLKAASVAHTLEVMEAMLSVVLDGAERMEKKLEAKA